METIILVTFSNIIFAFVLSGFILHFSRKYTDIRRHEIPCQIIARKTRGRKSMFKDYVFFLYGRYNNTNVELVLSSQEYADLKDKDSVYVYIREYKHKWMNPNFSKYDISIAEPDWDEKDKKSVIKGVSIFVLLFEFVFLCVYFGI